MSPSKPARLLVFLLLGRVTDVALFVASAGLHGHFRCDYRGNTQYRRTMH
jgi:hypothetical protein